MPRLDQNLILPGKTQPPYISDKRSAQWLSLFDPENPSGIAAVLDLGDAFLSKKVTAYCMGSDGKLTPIDPLDKTLPPEKKEFENSIFYDMKDTKMGQAFTAAFNNRLFVPTNDGKLVQVSLFNDYFDIGCALSAPFDNAPVFSPPPEPSIWKRIFFFLFLDELRDYRARMDQYEKFSDAEVVSTYTQAARDSAAKLSSEKPDDPQAAASRKDPISQFRVYLNRIAYSDVDWALEALHDEDCTVDDYCNGMAKNLEAQAARELLKKAGKDPKNANKILADAQMPFKTLRKELAAFVRKDVNMKSVKHVVNTGGAQSEDYDLFLADHYEYGQEALSRYYETLPKQPAGINNDDLQKTHGQKDLQSERNVLSGSQAPSPQISQHI